MRLSRQEQAVLNAARDMAKNGHIRPAAQMLDQAGLRRECIELLEKSGLVDDAAAVLMKMQRPNRAGFVYARNKQWKKATECFKAAGLFAEAAMCLKEDGEYEQAADLFYGIGQLEEASACYFVGKSWQKAGRIFLKLQSYHKAQTCYTRLFEGNPGPASLIFETIELEFFRKEIVGGNLQTHYIAALNTHGKIVSIIRSFLADHDTLRAADIFKKCPIDMGPSLISEVNLQNGEGILLAQMFQSIDKQRYAGMVYEQLSNYALAAECFEQDGDYTRAAYCYERAGNHEKTAALREAAFSSEQSLQNQVFSHSEATRALASPTDQDKATRSKTRPIKKTLNIGAGVFALDKTDNPVDSQVSDIEYGLFQRCDLFLNLESKHKEAIWKLGERRNLAAREIVVDWAELPHGFYFILDGELDCVLKSELGDVPLETITSGDTFGEIWLLTEHPARVKLITRSAARLLFIERKAFQNLLERDPAISRQVYKQFTHRLLSKLLKPLTSQDIREAS